MSYRVSLFQHFTSPFAVAWFESSLSHRNFVRIGLEKLSASKWGNVFCRLTAIIASGDAIPERIVLQTRGLATRGVRENYYLYFHRQQE